MSTLCKYPLKPDAPVIATPTTPALMKAVCEIPRKATIIHLGAEPPRGNIFIWATVPNLKEDSVDKVRMEFVLVMAGHEVPPGYTFRQAILSGPMMFVYEKDRTFVLHPS